MMVRRVRKRMVACPNTEPYDFKRFAIMRRRLSLFNAMRSADNMKFSLYYSSCFLLFEHELLC